MTTSKICIALVACATAGFAAADTPDPVIAAARKAASAFTDSLPRYVVKRATKRYQTGAASSLDSRTRSKPCNLDTLRATPELCPFDTVTAEIVTENGKETYTNLRVNGTPDANPDRSGTWSEGEFSTTLWAIFSPASAALFTNQRAVTIMKRPAWRYDFAIDHSHSSWKLFAGTTDYAPAYGGAIWIDKETSRVLRIEMAARELPASFPLKMVESAIEYNFVNIGDAKFLLPAHSEALYCERAGTACSKNVTDFQNYKRYTADATITFEETPK